MKKAHLAPSLSVSDFALVLQMGDHLRLSGKSPNQSSAIRSRILLGCSHMHPRFMHIRCSLVQRTDQEFHEPVYLRLVFIVIRQLECVVEEYVS